MVDTYQGFTDQAFRDSKRLLDPVWEENQRSFDQSMVNRGMAPGSKGFTFAQDAFGRDKNDQYSSAAFDSMGYGDKRRDKDRTFAENKYQDRRDYKKYDEVDNRGFDENQRRYDQEYDFNEMLTLDNVSRAYNDQSYRDAVFNSSRDDQQLSVMMQMMGFGPSGGAQPINMSSAFNNSLYGEVQNANSQNNRVNNYSQASVDALDAWMNRNRGGSGSQPSYAGNDETTGNF
jgi:hypothetical protein